MKWIMSPPARLIPLILLMFLAFLLGAAGCADPPEEDDDTAITTPTFAPDPDRTPTPISSPTPTVTPAPDLDQDRDGWTVGAGDCNDLDATVYPGASETPYDGVDQDCDDMDLTDQDEDGADGGPFGDDCNDLDEDIYPGADEIPYDGVDQDCDDQDLLDQDGDGANGGPSGTDCDDLDETRNPSATEIPYDGIDQDCDDQDLEDVDEDGYSSELVGGDDCDDTDPNTYPDANEVPYDGIDQDCDGADLSDVDDDGYSSTQVEGGTDCDDNNPNTYPGAPEFADGRDNDCDGQIDDDLQGTDDDGDGHSEADGDCNDADPSTYPGADEIPYDGIDQDCSGADLTDVDEDGHSGGPEGTDCNDRDASVHPGAAEVPYDSVDQDCSGADLVDVDQDGSPGVGSGVPLDCDDEDPTVHPGADEVAYDGIDQDCSGADLVDVDGDGFAGAGASGGTDCNDRDEDIYPGADEVCDGVDNNCDGIIDIDAIDEESWYRDADLDGYGDGSVVQLACMQPDGYVSNPDDCDDNTAVTYPGAVEVCDGADNDCDSETDEGVLTTYYRDADGDGHGDPNATRVGCTAPNGYSVLGDDCDDTRATVYPGAPETCNGLDDDCDAQIDEGVMTTWYQDLDRDGYGTTTPTTQSCIKPTGYAAQDGDCRDTNDTIYPGAPERCNGVDDDCNGVIDDTVTFNYYFDADNDGFGDPSKPTTNCNAPAGYVSNGTDCNDGNPNVHPGALELCNGVDDDCDAIIDEDSKLTFYRDADGDGFGTSTGTVQACFAPTGYVSKAGDCLDSNATVYPGAEEACNSLDDDCDGLVDEGVGNRYYRDVDGDQYGNGAQSVVACSRPAGYVLNGTDCDDNNASVYPGAPEYCNGLDDDCDAQIDEGVKTTYYQDRDGDGYGDTSITVQACQVPAGFVESAGDCKDNNAAINPGATEICNDIDDDCDALIDEGVRTNVVRSGVNYESTSSGCIFNTSAAYGFQCTGVCGATCTTYSHLDYSFATTPGLPYSFTVKVADYLHNCSDTLRISVYLNGVFLGGWTGTGGNTWATPSFSFVASSSTSSFEVWEGNDLCCGCSGTCTAGCNGDLNMYIDQVQLLENCK